MAYNTAICFILTGAGIILAGFKRARLAIIFGAIVTTFGLLTLIQHIGDVDFGFDHLLMNSNFGGEAEYKVKMAFNTAVCFLAVGVVIVASSLRKQFKWQPLLAIAGAVIGALGTDAFYGYLTGVKIVYDWGNAIPMSVHTAVGFSLVGIGIVAQAWRESKERNAETPQWFPIVIAASAVTATVCLWRAIAAVEEMAGISSHLPITVLFVGVITSLLLAWAIYFTLQSNSAPVMSMIIALILTGMVFAWLSWNIYDSYHTRTKIREQTLRMQELKNKILHLDEDLTMNARMAVLTGDRNWEDRYRKLEPQLDAALKETEAFAPDQNILQDVVEMDSINIKLVEMEKRSFALLSDGKVEGARDLLFGEKYETYKRVYAERVGRFIGKLETYMTGTIDAERDRTILSVVAAVIVLTISLLAWLAVIRNLQNSRSALMTSMSELKRSEEALRKAEGYQSLFQHANDSIIIFEPDTEVVLEINEKACEVYGFSRAEFIGKSLKELSQDVKRGEEKLLQILSTGSCQSFESVNFRADGTPLIFLINASVIEYNGKRAILSIHRDVTERRQAKDELERNLSLLSSTFEATVDGILAVDRDNNIISANKKFIEMWGIPEELRDLRDAGAIIDHQLSLLKKPDELVAKIKRSLQHPEEISFSNLELLDGRIIERYTQPQILNGKTVGRVMSFRDVTEREHAEEVLRESESRYRDLFENANDIIYVHDLEGNYVSINQAAERVIGYTREEIRSMNMEQIVAPEHLEMIQQKLTEKTAGAVKETAYEVDCIAKDGNRVTLEVNSRAIYKDGVAVAVQGIARDITERKQTQEALRTSEEQYRDLYENANDLIYTHDLRGNFTALNRAGEVITGYKREEAMKMNLSQVVAPEFLEAARAMTARKVAGEAPGTYELEIIAKKGNRVSLELSTRLIVQDGKPIGVQGIGRDITERKRADSALRESEYKLRTLLESMSEGLLQVDTEDRILFVNNYLCKMVGYSQEELIGSDWSLLLLDEGRDFIKKVNVRRRQGISDTYEICLRKKSGEIIWAMVGGVPMVDAKGNVFGSMGVFTDITERKRAEEQLLYDAFHDGLTGLANRALFMDHLQLTIERGKRKPESLYGILFLDFDRFKVINDSLGHAEGDKLLKLLAVRLESSLRPGDLVARLGGDEFTILLNELEYESDARRIAERIQADLKLPFDLSGREVFCSVSIGIAISSAGRENAEDMLRHADIAMYRAKAKGKAQHQVFDQEMHKHAIKQLEIETEMRYALERGDFCLHYQPIFDLETKRLVGFEALIRWKHPERGMISPGEFIPIAEENGLILQLGQWTVHESCRQLRQWQDTNPQALALTVSVNLSCREFLQLNLAEQVAATLKATGLDPGCLKLEITESHIMENSELAITIMNRLRILGVDMSLDDFGTGYSSLSYLHRLPVNCLKIDRSFINQMVKNEENREIVHTIIKLAQNLKMKVVAEGIETARQLEHLTRLKCDYGQGYFFSKPLEAGAAETFIERSIETLPFVTDHSPLGSRLEM